MCFRPNRRVNVHASYLEFNEFGNDQNESEEESEKFAEFINEWNEDEEFDYLPESLGKDEVNKESPKKAFGKGKRPLIKSKPFAQYQKRKKVKHTIQNAKEKNEWNTFTSYKSLKDSICVGCSKELQKGKLENSKDLFHDKTGGGTSLHEIFVSIIETEDVVAHTNYGSRLCNKCCLVLEQIEFYYHEWRSLVDGFRDTFILGQKNLDSDLGGGGGNTYPDNNDCSSVLQSMDVSKNAVVKILENNSLQSFSPKGIGIEDFHCR